MKQILASASSIGWRMLSVLLLVPLLLIGTGDSNRPGPGSNVSQGGWIAWLDPVSGRLSKKKPPEGMVLPLDAETLRQFSTSGVNLYPETRADGSMVLDLQGRFRQGSVATRDEQGQVKVFRVGGEMFLEPDGRDISRRLFRDGDGKPAAVR